ncbi:MAG TPA: monovalent cation/H+ antiporter subunit D family protein, partial [Thermoanaerobaculia bacterium]|nr:monovalent cation/H+ antiporter subunit D family protein [Thermoanaerobaculia bacterium]
PWTMTAFLLASLSIIGLPPFGGLWSKWYLVLGALEAGRGGVVGVLVASTLLNAAYLLPISLRAFFSGPCGAAERGGEAPAACVVPLVLTAASCVALFFVIDPWIALLEVLW